MSAQLLTMLSTFFQRFFKNCMSCVQTVELVAFLYIDFVFLKKIIQDYCTFLYA